jgi:hypothetical protein
MTVSTGNSFVKKRKSVGTNRPERGFVKDDEKKIYQRKY